jgi:hypothetical protein
MNANSDSKASSENPVATAQVTPDELGDVGRLLYGERWQSPLAAALGINDRTIRYWLAGTNRPEIKHVRALIALLERSRGEASDLIVHLRERMDHAAGDVDEEVWRFGQNELQLVDDQRVLHVPTRTMIAFHRYDNVPEDKWTPTGIVSNVGMFSGSALRRFQAEAWSLIKRHHYRR